MVKQHVQAVFTSWHETVLPTVIGRLPLEAATYLGIWFTNCMLCALTFVSPLI